LQGRQPSAEAAPAFLSNKNKLKTQIYYDKIYKNLSSRSYAMARSSARYASYGSASLRLYGWAAILQNHRRREA
jgi:hypothetical protein